MSDFSIAHTTLLDAYRVNQNSLQSVGGLGIQPSDQLPSLTSYAEQGAGSFLDLVQERLRETRSSLNAAEADSEGGIVGETSIDQVVLSLSEAESNLRAMLAVRDRLVSAYQEILRTPI